MRPELTRPALATWGVFERKSKFDNIHKASKLLFVALLGLGFLYQTEAWVLGQNAKGVVAQAQNYRQAIISQLGYSGDTTITDHDIVAKIMRVKGPTGLQGLLTAKAGFSDIWVVHSEESEQTYSVFFVDGVTPKFARELAAEMKASTLATQSLYRQDSEYCTSAEAGLDGRFSFCLTL